MNIEQYMKNIGMSPKIHAEASSLVERNPEYVEDCFVALMGFKKHPMTKLSTVEYAAVMLWVQSLLKKAGEDNVRD